MGQRAIKRVPLDFDWPQDEVWKGYLSEDYRDCPSEDCSDQAWKPTEPPMGDGYQLWETTSEGSPISPVFSTPEALAEWCETNATLFAGQGASYDEWLRIIQDDSVDLASTIMLTYREDD